MEEKISKLFDFLENFDVNVRIKIFDESNNLLFDGIIGDVPQRITNLTSVIGGTVINHGTHLALKVKKC